MLSIGMGACTIREGREKSGYSRVLATCSGHILMSAFSSSEVRRLESSLGSEEGKQIGVDRFCFRRRHAVRKSLVCFQGAVLYQLCR